MTTEIRYGALLPRYWFARAVWWLWQPSKGPWPSPTLAMAVDRARGQWTSLLDTVRQAEADLRWALDDQRQVHQDLADGDARRALAAQGVEAAHQTTRPRFEELDPAGRTFKEARQHWEQAKQDEYALTVEAEDFERAFSSPEREDLFDRHFGTELYHSNPFQRWKDKRLAQQTRFEQYALQRRAYFQRIELAEKTTEKARIAMGLAQEAADAAWDTHGHLFVDQEALEQALVIQQETEVAIAQAPLRKQAVDQAATKSRRALSQALVAFHAQASPALWEIARLAERLSKPEGHRADQQLARQGDIDRVCFYAAGSRNDLDALRVERMRLAGMWFVGQGPERPLPDGLPTWMAIAYGNTEGLPGTRMAQVGFGIQDP